MLYFTLHHIMLSTTESITEYISGSTSPDKCTYHTSQSSEYVTCMSRSQIPPYTCEGSGGTGNDRYQIHVLETDLSKVSFVFSGYLGI